MRSQPEYLTYKGAHIIYSVSYVIIGKTNFCCLFRCKHVMYINSKPNMQVVCFDPNETFKITLIPSI